MTGEAKLGARSEIDENGINPYAMLTTGTILQAPEGQGIGEDYFQSTVNSEEMKGALTITAGGAGTAGYAMIPIRYDPLIVDITRKQTPLVDSVIRRVVNQGTYAVYNNETVKASAVVAGEDGVISDQTSTYDNYSTAIKYLYAKGRITGPAQAAMPSWTMSGYQPSGSGLPGSSWSNVNAPNATQLEILDRARALKELEEDLILNGDDSSDANEFDGLLTLQSTTNKVALSAAVALANLATADYECFIDGGRPTIAVCSPGAYKTIKNLIDAKIGYMQPSVATSYGFSAITYNGVQGPVPLIPSRFLAEGSSSYGTVLWLDDSVIEMRVLQDMTYKELASTNDSDAFLLKIYECIINRNTAFSAVIKE